MIEYLSIMIHARRASMDERGASAVEYGLLVAGIAALIVAIVFLLGDQIVNSFDQTCDAIAAKDTRTDATKTCAP